MMSPPQMKTSGSFDRIGPHIRFGICWLLQEANEITKSSVSVLNCSGTFVFFLSQDASIKRSTKKKQLLKYLEIVVDISVVLTLYKVMKTILKNTK